MLGQITQCYRPSTPQIDYRQMLADLLAQGERVLAEVSNHNATVATDYSPIVNALRLNLDALALVAANQAATNVQIRFAVESIGGKIAELALSISDLQSATITAFASLVQVEADQTKALEALTNAVNEAARSKSVTLKTDISVYYRVGAEGMGLIIIPAGANEVWIHAGCYNYTINGDLYRCGHSYNRGHRTIGTNWVATKELAVSLPAGAEVYITYTSPDDIGSPAVENAVIITKDMVTDTALDDQAIADALAAVNAQLSNEA